MKVGLHGGITCSQWDVISLLIEELLELLEGCIMSPWDVLEDVCRRIIVGRKWLIVKRRGTIAEGWTLRCKSGFKMEWRDQLITREEWKRHKARRRRDMGVEWNIDPQESRVRGEHVAKCISMGHGVGAVLKIISKILEKAQ